MALPAVLAMFAIGSLLIVPSINYVATNLKAGTMAKEEFKGILAADAGVEDALWKIKNDTIASLPYAYQLTNINGLSVDVNICDVDTIAGEDVGDSGGHSDFLTIDKSVTYNAGIYTYILSLTNIGSGNIKPVKILIDFPPGVEYVTDSISSNVTTPLDNEPAIRGTSTTGITTVWENVLPLPSISVGQTKYHRFELSGPPGIEEVEGHGFVEASRDDVGTVWDSESYPYSIIAQAKDASGTTVVTIRAGVWGGGGNIEISCWQIIR